MTIRYVVDAHALIWYLYDDRRLSKTAGKLMDEIEGSGDQLAVSSITLVEVVYLVEKKRIDGNAFTKVVALLERTNPKLVEIPLDHAVVEAMRRVDRTQIPEMPDRIVAATALYLGVPVISYDHKIQSSNITTVW